jgi:hypothetical protein
MTEDETLEVFEFDLKDLSPDIFKALEPNFIRILEGMNEREKEKYKEICARKGRVPFWERN